MRMTVSKNWEKDLNQGSGMVAWVEPRSHQIIECNDPLTEMLGVEKSRLVGKVVFDLFSGGSRKAAQKVYQTFLTTQSVPEAELELENREGGKVPVTLRLSGTKDKRGRFHCTRFSWHNVSELKKAQKTLKRATGQLRGKLALTLREVRKRGKSLQKEIQKRKTTQSRLWESSALLRRQKREIQILAGRLIKVQEDERRRLARDLHDETNQKLAVLALQVAGLKQDLPLPADTLKTRLQTLHDHIGTLANDVRQLAHQLHPAILEHVGLVEALQSHLSEISEAKDIQVIFFHRNLPRFIPIDLSLCLYRVAQECLGNAIKHAHADTIKVSLVGLAKSLRLSIQDNGVGMGLKQFKRFSHGLGFVSMRERIRMVKGRHRVTSQPKKGTAIYITVPRPEETA